MPRKNFNLSFAAEARIRTRTDDERDGRKEKINSNRVQAKKSKNARKMGLKSTSEKTGCRIRQGSLPD